MCFTRYLLFLFYRIFSRFISEDMNGFQTIYVEMSKTPQEKIFRRLIVNMYKISHSIIFFVYETVIRGLDIT